MDDIIDHAFNRQLLERLSQDFSRQQFINFDNPELAPKLKVAIKYLTDHGLIRGDGRVGIWHGTITSKGMDYLSTDGGLTAKLGVITVRFDDETVRAFLAQRVEGDGNITTQEKSEIKKAIAGLPVEALKEIMKEATQLGLKHVPDLLPWIAAMARAAGHSIGI